MNDNNNGGGENLVGDFHAADTTESTDSNIAGRKRTISQTEGTIAAISFSLLAFLSFIRMILPLFFAFLAFLTFNLVISLLHSLL